MPHSFPPFKVESETHITKYSGVDIFGPFSTTRVADDVQIGGFVRNYPSVNHPNSNGWRSPSAYYRFQSRDVYHSGSITVRDPHRPGDFYTMSGPFPNWFGGWGIPNRFSEAHFEFGEVSNLDNRILTEVLLEMKHSDSFNLGADIAESAKTYNQLASLFSDVIKLYLGFKRRNIREIRNAVLGTGSTESGLRRRYLEYIYGIKPLVQDIYHIYGLLQTNLKKDQLLSATKSGKISRKDSFHNVDWDVSSQSEYKVRVKLYYKINSSLTSTLSNTGLDNPLSIIWELVPYSFVLDWLVPVGSTLEALSVQLGVDFVSGTISRKTSYHADFARLTPLYANYIDSASGQITGTRDGMEYSRSITGLPTPSFYIKSPFSRQHITNALALFALARR